MSELHVIRHVIRPHQPAPGEEYDPNLDMLIIVHRDPLNPDDPSELGHHVPVYGLAYRKEMWGLDDYASTVDLELKSLERWYDRDESGVEYGSHPLADITGHYFEGPKERMLSFAPSYIMDRATAGMTALPGTTDGVVRMCLDVVLSGIDDVKGSLASAEQQTFPCKGMTGLSTDSIDKRSSTMQRMEEQTQRLALVSSGPLDDVRQLLTDRGGEMERAREGFVNHALLEGGVPEIMRKRVVRTAVRRGILEENAWM